MFNISGKYQIQTKNKPRSSRISLRICLYRQNLAASAVTSESAISEKRKTFIQTTNIQGPE